MQLGMVGLGRMGGNIVRRLMRHGHSGVVYDQNPKAVGELAGEGATPARSLDDLVTKLAKPRAVWVMLPAGEVTEAAVMQIGASMGAGNIPRTPGRDGRDPRAERGYLHCGPSGAGHFVKMIHNGIEYGLMQAYAEGFSILRGAKENPRPEDERYDLDLADVAEVWRRGSVISSWLLDLTAGA